MDQTFKEAGKSNVSCSKQSASVIRLEEEEGPFREAVYCYFGLLVFGHKVSLRSRTKYTRIKASLMSRVNLRWE